jgi:multidrug/hemolysin transport system ATP-binding protein
MVANGTPIDLKNTYTADYVTLYNVADKQVEELGVEYQKINGAYRICLKNTSTAKQLILNHPDVFNDFEIVKGKMDDVFLAVTGRTLGEE